MSITFTNFRNQEWENKIEQGLNSYLETVTKQNPSITHGIYCFHETQLVGGVLFQTRGNILWIETIYVVEQFRKKSIGKQLINKVYEYGAQHNVTEIQLHTYFEEAKDFFISCQFEEVTCIPNWKYGINCYLLKKRL